MIVNERGVIRPTISRTSSREIYIVRAKVLQLIKIGVANNAVTRLRELQGSCPDELELLAVFPCHRGGLTEKELHAQFHHLRAHGEWFRSSADLLLFAETYELASPRRFAVVKRAMETPTRHRQGRPKGTCREPDL